MPGGNLPALLLASGVNLRDLGGYATHAGRTVRHGLLYRSGTLAHLDAGDRAIFARWGVRTVLDLRTAREAERDPPFDWHGIERLHWDYDRRQFGALGATKATDAETMRAQMIDFYARAPWAFAPQFGAMFQRMLAGEVPLLVHCSAGKDRTGMAAALILSALDVPRETIEADYVATDDLVDLESELVARAQRDGVSDAAGFSEIASFSPETRAPMLRADPAYLDACFAAIEARHGSVTGFLEDVLALDPGACRALRDRFVE